MTEYRKIPAISGKQLIKLLIKDGWIIKRRKGDHVSLAKDFTNRKRVTVIKNTAESIPRGTRMAILGKKQTNLGKKGLIRLLNKYGL